MSFQLASAALDQVDTWRRDYGFALWTWSLFFQKVLPSFLLFSFVFCLLFYVANTGSMLWASQFSGVGGTGEVSIRRHWGSAPPGQQGALRVEGWRASLLSRACSAASEPRISSIPS